MEKKLRFGDLVRNSGRPQIVTLWTQPEENRDLTKAIKGNRVLTVIQEPGKRDYGVIGFKKRPGTSFLIFPQALPKEPAARVVGINYQLAEEPLPIHATTIKPGKQPAPAEPLKPSPPVPQTRKFKVKIRRIATIEDEIDVEASSRKAAEHQAMESAQEKAFDLEHAKIRREIVNAR